MGKEEDTCLAMLREGDRDRYLCALLSPDSHRGPIAALYAFNMEIARLRDVVSEPMMGEVRLQWWADLIESGSGGDAAGHPVAAALLQAIDDHDLPRRTLINMIEARRFDLYDDPMPDRNTFEGYAGETASALIQLCAQILDAGKSGGLADVAGHAGVTQLVAGSLLLLPTHRARGQLYVPGEILAAAGLDRERFLAGDDVAGVSQVLSAFIALGREHLGRARDAAGGGRPACFPAFLPVCLAEPVFDRAEKGGASVMEQAPVIPQWRRQIRLWNAARRQRF